MSFPIGYEAKAEFEKLKAVIARLAVLTLEVNAQTPYAVFLDISGHVGTLMIDVGKDKDKEYGSKLFEEEFYFQYDYELTDADEYNAEDEKLHYIRAIEKAEYMIARLEKFLKDSNPGEQPVKLW